MNGFMILAGLPTATLLEEIGLVTDKFPIIVSDCCSMETCCYHE